MSPSIFRFTLDMHSHRSQATVSVFRRDTAVRLILTLSDGGKPFDIDAGCTAILSGTKADLSKLWDRCVIVGNTIQYDFNEQTASCVGLVDCEITLYGTDGEVVTAPKFMIVVDEREVSSLDIQSTDHIDPFDPDKLVAIYQAEEARVEAENKRISAGEVALKAVTDAEAAANRADAASNTAINASLVATKNATAEVTRIIGELGIVQSMGNSTNAVMSQAAVTKEIESLFNKRLSSKWKPLTRIVNDCQTESDWTFTNNDNLSPVDTTNFILGSQSLHCNGNMGCFKNTYDMLNNDLVLKIKVNSIERGAWLLLRVANQYDWTSAVFYQLNFGSSWTTPQDWQEVAIPFNAYAYTAGNGVLVDFSRIDSVYLMAEGGVVDFNLQYIGVRPRSLKNGIVTFTFDHGLKSQYTGIKALAEKGITGTVFHITEATSSSFMTKNDLQNLVNYYGTDIEVHGDPSYDQWSETDLIEHWGNAQKFLKDNGLGDGKHMSYHSGIFPDNVVQLAKSYFESARTHTSYIPLETYPPADRYRIRSVSFAGSVDSVKKHIDDAMASGSWLILAFHEIGDGESCSVSDLKAIADYAIDSGAHIMNYAEVLDSCILTP